VICQEKEQERCMVLVHAQVACPSLTVAPMFRLLLFATTQALPDARLKRELTPMPRSEVRFICCQERCRMILFCRRAHAHTCPFFRRLIA